MTTEKLNKLQLKQDLPVIKPGDTIRVHQKIKESSGKAQDKGEKERIQVFEGIVIAKKHGQGISGTITVRKVIEGVGVERIFPIHSPLISKIEVVKSGKVRRAKLYYLRQARGKKSKLKSKDFASIVAAPELESFPEEKSQEANPEEAK